MYEGKPKGVAMDALKKRVAEKVQVSWGDDRKLFLKEEHKWLANRIDQLRLLTKDLHDVINHPVAGPAIEEVLVPANMEYYLFKM